MAKKAINLGTAPAGRDGDSNRVAFNKLQSNFDETYTALGADVGGNLPTALPYANGGTAATTLAEAKQNLGIDKVNNTSDLNKPVSTVQQNAINAARALSSSEIAALETQTNLNLSGKEPTLAAGTAAQYYRGDKTWQTLDKSAVGLGSVNDTSDASKPVSTATQLALNDKVNKADVIAITKGGTGATSAAVARTNLGLGDAATKNVGKLNGQLPEFTGNGLGGNGYGGNAPVVAGGADLQNYSYVTGWYGLAGTYANSPIAGSHTSLMLVSIRTYGAGAAMIFQLWANSAAEYYIGQSTWNSNVDGTYTPSSAISWKKVYSTGNTTVDANGFIKAASPIVQLYADRIELNSEAKEQLITFEKLGVGDYLIKGSTGFAQEGWYIEQPKDANGNIYHAVIYNTLENGDISVKTYAKSLNVTGEVVADLDNPVDVKENRFISLRLQEQPKDESDQPIAPEIVDSEGVPAPSPYHVLDNGIWIISGEDAARLEQQRLAAMPALKRRQFRLALVMNGYVLSDVDALINQIEDPMQRIMTQVEWQDATDFERTNTTLITMAGLMGLTTAQVDSLWLFGLSI